jgi:hypothetical protein
MSITQYIQMWQGSGSAVTSASNSTPFGFYDNEPLFCSDAPKVANWCAKRLGYPIMNVEMIDLQFYACFEEAVTEYSAQVNQFNIRENILQLQGSTPSSKNLSQTPIRPNLGKIVRVAHAYGTEVGVGGDTKYYSASIAITESVQRYDLSTIFNSIAPGKYVEVKRIYHYPPPAIKRFFDPLTSGGVGSMGFTNMLDTFGYGGYSAAVTFTMMPIYEDLLRVQAIEFNDTVRKSGYGWELVGTDLKIFPIPDAAIPAIWFDYVVRNDMDSAVYPSGGMYPTGSIVTDYSNAKYDNIPYTSINDVGKQWIKKYTLAVVKELLGAIRQKFATIPIPNNEVTLNGDALKQEAQQEKELLYTQLRENLEQTNRHNQMQFAKEEADNLQSQLKQIPLPIYIGTFLLFFIPLFIGNNIG